MAPRARIAAMNPPPAPPSPRVQSGSAQIAFESVGDPILAIAAAARDIDPSVYAPAETRPEPAIVPVIRDTPHPPGAVYANPGEAREAAERIALALGVRPVVTR